MECGEHHAFHEEGRLEQNCRFGRRMWQKEEGHSEAPLSSLKELINQGLRFYLTPAAVTDKTLKGQGLGILNVNLLFT